MRPSDKYSDKINMKSKGSEFKLNWKESLIASKYYFIPSRTAKGHKKITPAIYEARLMENVLTMAHVQRYGTRHPGIENHSAIVKDDLLTDSLETMK